MTPSLPSQNALAGLLLWIRERAGGPAPRAPAAPTPLDDFEHSWSVNAGTGAFDDAWLQAMRGYQAALCDLVANVPGACEVARARSNELAAFDLASAGAAPGAASPFFAADEKHA